MRRRQHRHPVLEAAVFAAALLLAAFVGRELWRRRAAQSPALAVPEAAVDRPVALNPTYPSLTRPTAGGRTEAAVSGVPPLKLTRVQRRRPKPSVVPPPK